MNYLLVTNIINILKINLFIAKSLNAGGKDNLPGKRNSLIAAVSIAVSMVVMIVAISISDGFSKEIGDKVTGFTGNLVVKVPGEEPTNNIYPLTVTDAKIDSLSRLAGVNLVQGIAYSSGVVKYNDHIEGVLIKGVSKNYNWSFVKDHLTDQSLTLWRDSLGSDEIVISARLATKLNLKVGERPFFYFIGESIKVRRFTVAGIFDARLEEVDKGLIFCNIENTRGVLGWDNNQYSSLEILANGKIIKEEVEKMFNDADVASPDELFPHLFDWLTLLDFNVMIVIILMMVVAGFNMISGLLIILFEKISMIGLLKSLGMRDSSIHKIFLYRAISIVLKGIIAGNLFALALLTIQKVFKVISLDPDNYFVTHIPVDINFLKILILDLAALGVITVILYIPSSFISGMEPDKSLRQK